jgi:molecular chaperone HscB
MFSVSDVSFVANTTSNPAIVQASASQDYFSVFGLRRKLNIDTAALQREFYAKSRQLHPDNFATASPEQQQWSLEQTSLSNDAFRTLKDPIDRTKYLLELEGVKLEEQSSSATVAARENGAEKKQVVPPELLEEVFELNMQLQELKMAKQMGEDSPETAAELRQAKEGFENKLQALETELKSLSNHWDAVEEKSAPGEAGRNVVRDKMVDLLNRRSYMRNLVRDVNEVLA